MKKFIEYMAEFLKDKNNSSSHKRLIAVNCFIVAVIVAFTTQDVAIAGLFLGVGGFHSGSTLFEKNKNG